MKINALAGEQSFEILIERENGNYIVEFDGRRSVVDMQRLEGDFYSFLIEGRSYEVSVEPSKVGYLIRHGASCKTVNFVDPTRRAREGMQAGKGPHQVVTLMPGRVVRLLVAEGDAVEVGQGVAVVEAMKMENEITSEKAGKVTSIAADIGQNLENNGVIMVIE
jgi:biotin carboxyl carrier protein